MHMLCMWALGTFIRREQIMLRKLRNALKSKKGQGLVEYGILIGGVALVCLAAVALLGHKTNDLIAVTCSALPCAHDEEAGPIVSGKLVATTTNASGGLILDVNNPGSLASNLGLDQTGLEAMIIEP